jgi:hypothetical protein
MSPTDGVNVRGRFRDPGARTQTPRGEDGLVCESTVEKRWAAVNVTTCPEVRRLRVGVLRHLSC